MILFALGSESKSRWGMKKSVEFFWVSIFVSPNSEFNCASNSKNSSVEIFYVEKKSVECIFPKFLVDLKVRWADL